LAAESTAILYGTSEISEARDLGHRILVMSAGRVVAEFDPSVSEQQIMEAAGGLHG
jgi:ABC-type sugar transport system ATPase subunit